MGWVTERHRRTLDVTFRQLREAVERDVKEANNLLSEERKSAHSFVVSDENVGPTQFLVRGFPIEYPAPSFGDKPAEYKFSFRMEGSAIEIERHGPSTLPDVEGFLVVQRWSPRETSCLLYIEGEEFSIDEISQIALEPMFFMMAD